jgi:hypothetical protein
VSGRNHLKPSYSRYPRVYAHRSRARAGRARRPRRSIWWTDATTPSPPSPPFATLRCPPRRPLPRARRANSIYGITFFRIHSRSLFCTTFRGRPQSHGDLAASTAFMSDLRNSRPARQAHTCPPPSQPPTFFASPVCVRTVKTRPDESGPVRLFNAATASGPALAKATTFSCESSIRKNYSVTRPSDKHPPLENDYFRDFLFIMTLAAINTPCIIDI